MIVLYDIRDLGFPYIHYIIVGFILAIIYQYFKYKKNKKFKELIDEEQEKQDRLYAFFIGVLILFSIPLITYTVQYYEVKKIFQKKEYKKIRGTINKIECLRSLNSFYVGKIYFRYGGTLQSNDFDKSYTECKNNLYQEGKDLTIYYIKGNRVIRVEENK